MDRQVNIALAGLGFGASFAAIYKHHPNVGRISLFDPDRKVLEDASRKLEIPDIYHSFEELLADPSVDAVHLVTPIPLHEEQTVQVLQSGKHCACTVPMAISLDGIQRITEAVRSSGKNYMMMETTLYTYQFFYIQEMLANGAFGMIQFLRGSHYQNMANWPSYWMGLPPMYYGTHAIAPLRSIANSRICRVHGFGSGTMDKSMHVPYGNPYPVECAVFEFENGLKAEATRSLFETTRSYQEGLFIYGSNASFEWGFKDGDQPYLQKALPASTSARGQEPELIQLTLPNYHQSLPEAIQRFTVGGNFDPTQPQKSLENGSGGGHHGSHPHLVHEFVRSIIEERKPAIDEILGGNITGAGICAHESAMNDGKVVLVPKF